jgi:hypothetical protein
VLAVLDNILQWSLNHYPLTRDSVDDMCYIGHRTFTVAPKKKKMHDSEGLPTPSNCHLRNVDRHQRLRPIAALVTLSQITD